MSEISNETCHQANPLKILDCDRECWVKARILTAMRMALSIKRERSVCADDQIYQCALEGIANGTAVEIIQTVGMVPEYVNLRKVPLVSENHRGMPSIQPTSLDKTP